MTNIREILALGQVMPVLVLENVADAVPVAQALVSGGVRVLEITLRTSTALDSVRAIRAEVPDAVVGVGTITCAAELDLAREAGAEFGVSPGVTPALLDHARISQWPFLPGVMTPSDILAALQAGFTTVKFFPAQQAGGVTMLNAYAGPFPAMRFCPTGGIDAQSAADYLVLPNVICVGGSWLAPANLIAQHDWPAIAQLARDTATLLPHR